jgi:hypothetical protein
VRSQLIRLRCVLRVSHPLNALLPPRSAELIPSRSRLWGSPFEASLLRQRRTSSRTPFPHGVSSRRTRLRAPTFRAFTLPESRPKQAGISRCSYACLLGLGPLLGFLFAVARRSLDPLLPSHASPTPPLAEGPVVVPGFPLPRTQPLSLETDMPTWGFPPRQPSRLFRPLTKAGYDSHHPSRPIYVAADLLLAPRLRLG